MSRPSSIKHLRVIRGKRPALHDFSVQIARGHHHRPARPVRLRQDHADPLHRRHPDRRRRHRHRARPTRPAPPSCAAASVTCRRTRPSTTTCGSSTTSATSRRCTGSTASAADDAHRAGRADRSPNRLLRQPIRRSAHPGVAGLRAGLPTRPAGARRAHRRPGPRAAGRPLGAVPPSSPARGTTLLVSSHVMDEADHCGDLLLMRDGPPGRPHHPDPTTRGHRMHVTGGSVSVHHPAQHRSRQAG